MAKEGFWNDIENANKVNMRMKAISSKLDKYKQLMSRCEDLEVLMDMADEENDESLVPEIQNDFALLDRDIEALKLESLLKAVDTHWMDHIDAMDQLRQGIGLQALGQKDPVVAYRNMGFDMFDEMVLGIREQTVRSLFHVSVRAVPQQREQLARPVEVSAGDKPKPKRTDKKPGRNDPCPCGSGLKYKNCCGRNQ